MVEKIHLGDQDWTIDSRDLNFTDATLNTFFEKISGIIDYVGSGHALAMKIHAISELEYKKKYIEKFKDQKDQGKSDKTAELSAEGDQQSIDLKMKTIEAKYCKDRLYAHLSALNAAREDAHNRGHMLRKEMDKLNISIERD
jgi:hypothetical protein